MTAPGRVVHERRGRGIDWEPDLGHRAARDFVAQPDVTAIIVAKDRVAFGVCSVAQELGLSIPTTLSVISFDDEQLTTFLRPPVTTLRLPHWETGTAATSMVQDSAEMRAVDSPGYLVGGPGTAGPGRWPAA
ncbi:substrate-binding domain-containing protein [Actinomyces provencensis]|uniref:substrate-binding domain-containing protein n=1 Tax=Actinomyces provencensis TaxID=1720198 RepID=UPI00096ABC44